MKIKKIIIKRENIKELNHNNRYTQEKFIFKTKQKAIQ